MDAFGFAMDACATEIFAEGGSLKKQETMGHKELAAARKEPWKPRNISPPRT